MSPLQVQPKSSPSIKWDGSPTLSALSPINHLLFFTPTGIGSSAPSPSTNSSPVFSTTTSIDSVIPRSPPSPFIFPGSLIGFPESHKSPPALTESGTLSHVPVDPVYTGAGSGLPSLQQSSDPPLLFQPHSQNSEPAVQNRWSITGLFLGALKGPVLPSDSASHSLPDGFTNLDATPADIVEQVQALGDRAIEGLNALQSSLVFENLRSNQPQPELEMLYNNLIDSKNAIEMRQGATLADIGFCLGQLSSLLTTYDNDVAATASIDDAISIIEQEDLKRGLGINFVGLDRHRSTASSYGASLSQKYRLLFIKFDMVMEAAGSMFQAAASIFIRDPSSLRDSRLAQFFTDDHSSGWL